MRMGKRGLYPCYAWRTPRNPRHEAAAQLVCGIDSVVYVVKLWRVQNGEVVWGGRNAQVHRAQRDTDGA